MKLKLVLLTAVLALLGAGQATAQTRIITGRVTDSLTSEVITSGRVTVQGTTIGTTISDDGTFTVAVPQRDVLLSLRSIGFKRRDVAVPVSQNSVQASLDRDFFQLEAIVVTGQATGVERRNLANAVSSISAEQLVKTATATVDQALVGKLAGAQIYQNSFAPGGGIAVKMRSGVNSVLGSSIPLWVVDGVIINNQEIGSGLNLITKGGGTGCSASGSACGNQDMVQNRASDINPNDIQSVEVLKGAAAAAIYGSKANNGVILITTKKGRTGAPQFTVTQRVGVSAMSKRVGPFRRWADTAEVFNAGGTGVPAFAPVNVRSTFNTNYYDHEMALFGGKPISHETSVSMGGGTENTRYYASGLFHHDGGIQDRTGYDKQSIKLNLDHTVSSRFSFGFGLNGIHSGRSAGVNNNDNSQTSMYIVLPVIPTWMDLAKRPDGTYPLNPFANSNPYETQDRVDVRENTWRVINSGRVDLALINTASQSLRLVSNGGLDWYAKGDFAFSPADLQFESLSKTPQDLFPGAAAQSASFVSQMNVTTSLVHTLKPASGAFSATTSIGANYEQRSFNFSQTQGRYLIANVPNVSDGAVPPSVAQAKNLVKDAGYYASEEFLTLKDKLLLTAGVTADQSSTNSDPTQLYYYPKLGASYRMNLIRGLVDDVKIRVAYGQTGNKPLYGDKFTSLGTGQIEGIPTISLGTTLIKPLRPERQAEIEGGIDATLFGARANLEVTGYQRNVTDLLINRSVVASTGLSTVRFNGATIRTRGAEAALAVIPIRSRDVQWQLRTTFSTDKTRLTSLPVPAFNVSGLQLGGIRFVQDSLATQVWANDTLAAGDTLAPTGYLGCAAAWTSSVTVNAGTGRKQVTQVNGCRTTQRKVGDLNPAFTLGFSNDLKVKAFTLNFLFTWQSGGLVSNLTAWLFDIARTTRDYTQPCGPTDPCIVIDTLGNKETIGQMRTRLFPNYVGKIRVEDASYIKLRELNLSVEIPKSFTSKFWSGARFVRMSVSGRNLWTSSRYTGADPEVANSGSRNFRIGFDDIAPYPPSRSFWFNIDVGF